MAQQFEQLEEKHIQFIEKQQMFFVATAAKEGFVNVSPKGMDSFRVINPSTVLWLNLTGSGNETAAHIKDTNRMTIMFCSFDKQPLILRLYGKATVVHRRDQRWSQLVEQFPPYAGARQFYEMCIEMVQTSCGFAVPYYEPKGERPTLVNWAESQGDEGLRNYWQKKNVKSLDNLETDIFSDS